MFGTTSISNYVAPGNWTSAVLYKNSSSTWTDGNGGSVLYMAVPWCARQDITNEFHVEDSLLSLSASQEITRLLCNRVNKNPPSVPILSQKNPVHTLPPNSLTSTIIVFSHLHLDLTSDLFLSGFKTKRMYGFLISLTCATCPVHVISLIWPP